MDFTTLFGLFYTKFRGEESPPGITDPEWAIAVRNYNDALNRMENFDDTKWNFLWTTAQLTGAGATKTITDYTDTTYTGPTDMREPGGILTLIDTNGNRNNYPIIQPHEAQAMSANSLYGYWTGDPWNGWTLHINGMSATHNGWTIDYDYYKKVTRLNPDSETGSSVIPGGDPAFYYLHMAAQRFLDARNTPAYQVMLRDSEEALKGMKLKNNSGSYYNSWTMLDSGGGFGV